MPNSTVTAGVANNPAAKVTELQMLLSNDANKDKCIMLVEGVDDRKFYTQFVDENHVVMYVLDGCFFMPQILTLANAKQTLSNKVIGIKDSDFDQLTGKNYGIDYLFTTDTHDWETMVMSNECEDHVSIEALGKKEAGLFARVMSDLINYSYLKFYNEIEVCGKSLDGILFKGFPISKIYDGNNPCDLENSLQELRRHGNNATLAHYPTVELMNQFKQKYNGLNLYHLTCGHDVIHGIVCRLTFLRGRTPEIGYLNIERLFRASCSNDFFKKTRLYQLVQDWSVKHHTTVWAA